MGDAEIDYMNSKRGIPHTLSPEENLLYCYGNPITLKVLEEMRRKYAETQEKETMESGLEIGGVTLSA